MTTPECVAAAVGVPASVPVVASNEAQDGLLAMLKLSLLPSGSDAVGRKEYFVPATTPGAGVPPMVGARLAASGQSTRRTNGSRDADALPSVTLILTRLEVPTSPSLGVPARVPVRESNVAQAGLPLTWNVSRSSFASNASGVNR